MVPARSEKQSSPTSVDAKLAPRVLFEAAMAWTLGLPLPARYVVAVQSALALSDQHEAAAISRAARRNAK